MAVHGVNHKQAIQFQCGPKIKHLESVPRHLCSTFYRLLIKMHTPVKESTKGKIIKISSLTHCHFSLEKFTGMRTNFLQRFIVGNDYVFSPFGSHSEYLALFFNVTIRVCCNTKSHFLSVY